MAHIHWSDIAGLHNVLKAVEAYPHLLGGRRVVTYRPKVKLHGSNGAVQVKGNGELIVQTRERVVAPSDDFKGIAKWVEQHAEVFRAKSDRGYVYFGEWCGPGVMGGTAVSQIPEKIFALFAAAHIPKNPEDALSQIDAPLIVNPKDLGAMIGDVPYVYIIPWHSDGVQIPLGDGRDAVAPFVKAIVEEVEKVEKRDPFVADYFGIEGTGEGLVYYPLGASSKVFFDLAFKAKGEKHKTVTKAAPAQVDPAVAASISEFASMVLTEARLEQGARAIARGELVFDKKLIGAFISWIGKDVSKETEEELKASGLTWKQVSNEVSAKARAWYLGKAGA